MTWNWQRTDWPNFSWDPEALVTLERKFLVDAGALVGAVRHLDAESRDQFFVETMSVEAVTTSEIEGEMLDRASVQSSIRKQLGLATDNRRASFAEQGIAEMTVDVYRSAPAALTEDVLFAWHRMITLGRRDLADVGAYRTQVEPMQVVSGSLAQPKVHFQAPPSSIVPEEMTRFLKWYAGSGPEGAHPLPALARSALAHLHFVSVHPFEDGNGRIGRAISEKSLIESVGRPILVTLSATLLQHRKRYYQELERSSSTNEVTAWIVWFAEQVLTACQRSAGLVDFLLLKTKTFDELKDQINSRQEKVLLRMFREGPGGFQGGLSAANYVRIVNTSASTATRDLADLVEKGALVRIGDNRQARYFLASPPLTTL